MESENKRDKFYFDSNPNEMITGEQSIEHQDELRDCQYEYLPLGKSSFLGDGSPLKELNRT